MVRNLTRNQAPGNRLRVRIPCPPLRFAELAAAPAALLLRRTVGRGSTLRCRGSGEVQIADDARTQEADRPRYHRLVIAI